ncbi:MAG: zf-TFIIB domain-containing protein [Nocardioidaceae bacterium]
MDPMTCPECGSEMTPHDRGGVTVAQCTSCSGVFLRRIDLGILIENENEWHVSSGPTTQPIPRITPGMSPPPTFITAQEARSYIDALFG